MPSESRLCAVSGRMLCVDHTLVAQCGSVIDPAIAIALEDGATGCPKHYTRCDHEAHPLRITEARPCVVCDAPLCDEHQAVDVYDGEALCENHELTCGWCGLTSRASRDGSPLCVWCSDLRRLRSGATDNPHDAVLWEVYLEYIKPRQSFFSRMTGGVFGTGTDKTQVFRVGGTFSESRWRRVDGVLEQRVGGQWKPV